MFALVSNLALISVAMFANNSNQSHSLNHTYQVVMEQYNTSNCSVPFQNYSFHFLCHSHLNESVCCAEEYEKLNTSFGNARCNRYQDNDTYVHFQCRTHQPNGPNSSKKQDPYIVAGIALGAVILCVCFVACASCALMRCRRKPYGRI